MAVHLSVAFGLFVFSFIILYFRSGGELSDNIKRRVAQAASFANNSEYVDEDLGRPLSERMLKPFLRFLSQKFLKFAPDSTKQNNMKKNQNDKLKKSLQQAGMSLSVNEYSLIRFLVILGSSIIIGCICALAGLGVKSFLGVILGAYAGFAVMRFHLSAGITKRRRAIEKQLPNVLDLLSISVEAGLGFEQAMLQVMNHFSGYLIDELTITCREMSMGRTRREALILFAERCGLNEVKTFVGAVIQAGQMGISIKNVLRTQASAIRIGRRNKAEEKAMKISVKILLPMVIFIFPVLFIVLMGPAVVKIIYQFKG